MVATKSKCQFFFSVNQFVLPFTAFSTGINVWSPRQQIKGNLNTTEMCSSTANFSALILSFEQKFHGKDVLGQLNKRIDNLKGAVSRNSAKLGNYKMPVKLRETKKITT